MVFKVECLLIRDVLDRTLGHHKVVLWRVEVGGCVLGDSP
jgi:hypothetical protein